MNFKFYILIIFPLFLNLTACAENKSYKIGWNIVNGNGSVVAYIENDYDYIGKFKNGFAPVKKNGKWGFIDSYGKEILSPQIEAYESLEVEMCEKGIAKIAKENKAAIYTDDVIKWGIIDISGKQITPIKYNEIDNFNEGLARVRVGENYGFINEKGEEVIPIKYSTSTTFINGVACMDDVIRNTKDEEIIPEKIEKFGNHNLIKVYINYNGEKRNFIMNEKLDRNSSFWFCCPDCVKYNQGCIPNKWYFCSKANERIVTNYEEASTYFSEGLAAVRINGKWGFVDEQNKLIIAPKYSFYPDTPKYSFNPFIPDYRLELDEHEGQHSSFSDGLVTVLYKDSLYYIDKKGNKVLSFSPETYGGKFSEGRAVISIVNEKTINTYLIDKKGNKIAALPYGIINEFSEGLAAVCNDGKMWGFINREGVLVIPQVYDNVGNFCYGLSKVEKNRKYGYIDKTGKEVIPIKYDGILPLNEVSEDSNIIPENLGIVDENNKQGVINMITGKEIIPPKYTELNRNIVLVNEKFYLKQYIDFDNFHHLLKIYLMGYKENSYYDILNSKTGELIKTSQYRPKQIIQEDGSSVFIIESKTVNGKYYSALIDEQGKELTTIQYYRILNTNINKVYLIENESNKRGLINSKGKEICSIKYDSIEDFINGFAKTYINGKFGYINEEGEEILPPIFKTSSDFSVDGIVAVKM